MKTPKKTTIEINEKEYDGDRNNLELESGDYIVYTFNHFGKWYELSPSKGNPVQSEYNILQKRVYSIFGSSNKRY